MHRDIQTYRQTDTYILTDAHTHKHILQTDRHTYTHICTQRQRFMKEVKIVIIITP